MEVAIDHPPNMRARMREQWRRYRFMVERAWQFEAAGGRSLRDYVQWIDDQISERARVTEAAVPETDEDSVRVMTIHASKGLEFPVVILTGVNSDFVGRVGRVLFDRRSGRIEVRVGNQNENFSTEGYDDLADSEKRMKEAEGVRLMYVAATRPGTTWCSACVAPPTRQDPIQPQARLPPLWKKPRSCGPRCLQATPFPSTLRRPTNPKAHGGRASR